MDLERIKLSVDVERTRRSRVAVFGAGGSVGLIESLDRCGVARFELTDPDVVAAVNVARQGHHPDQAGRPKVEAVAAMIRRINPAAETATYDDDFTELTDEEFDRRYASSDVFVFATDRHEAQACGNRHALRLGTPAVWPGLYPGGQGGEVIFWHPGIDACHRCLCESRYAAHEAAWAGGRTLDPPSDGCTIFDVGFVDAVCGQIVLGLLTRGADDRHGQLIEGLGDRNFLQIQLDPAWAIGGRSPVRTHLGVPAGNDGFFAWCTVARRDPDRGQKPCPDCERFRGHRFVERDGRTVRLKPSDGVTLDD